ncbi:hypothetical protein [Mesorhizobium sp. DCY119]|uniref:hypothetical protein n=1 Tax=Mesorhizobium sp. DCY119 TaxID=2108445 RepID=UPI000E6D124E|nr:hypothetical protein [Mesorhizobium sp. DCY119]RJG46435.1 hypothetical protein D3Y55_20790 [Mesorhizobium sp. DCY119]
MTLRLSLVIDGNATGAKQAAGETKREIEELGKAADETAKKVEKVGKPIEWNTAEFDRARLGLKETADEGQRAADNVSAVADAGAKATPELGNLGEAAGVATGKFSGLSGVLVGIAGGLAAGIAITAIGEGLKAAAGAAGDLFFEITSNAPMIERDLKSHEQLVKRIKGAWAEAAGGASSYGLNSASVLRFQAQQNVGRLERDLDAATNDYRTGALHPAVDSLHNNTRDLGPLAEEVRKFRQELREGEADVIAFRNRIATLAEALPADSPSRAFAEQLLEQTEVAAKLQSELERARDLLQGLKGDAEAAATALGGKAEKYGELKDSAATAGEAIGGSADQIERTERAATTAIPALGEYDRLLKSIAAGGAGPNLGNPNRAALTPILEGRQFAAGGWTGDMPPDQIAGFVHGREYVFDAEATARIGVGNLDAIRRGVKGYAAGGYVGSLPMAGATAGRAGAAGGLADEFGVLRGSMRQFGMTLWQTKDAGAALGTVIQSVSQRFLDLSLGALDQLLLGSGKASGAGGAFGLIGNLLGIGGTGLNYFPPAPSAVGVGLYHGGGRVGPMPSTSRMVPPSVFMDAPRMHGGGWLKPGERPVIAMDGEEIGWPDDLSRKYGGGGQTVINNFHVETPNPKAFGESRSSLARAAGRLASRSERFS